MRKTKTKNYVAVVLVVLLLGLSIGYAAFSDSVKISGTATTNGTFDLQFKSASLDASEGVLVDERHPEDATHIAISEDKGTANVVVTDLQYPGAGAQFTVVIENAGTIPAILNAVTPVGIDDDDIVVTFPEMTEGEKIAPQGECSITFTVQWNEQSTDQTPKELDFSLQLDYKQDTTPFQGTVEHK